MSYSPSSPRKIQLPYYEQDINRWGTAHMMLDHAHELCQPITSFLNGADELFSPITTLRKKGRLVKHIEWSTFKLVEQDWIHVVDTKDILADANNIQQVFSSEKQPTLWITVMCILPSDTWHLMSSPVRLPP
ncbi:hypothetical protein DXG01_014660 [Tephrocybe rancida]|nr:hypothetical protein DXG01_014660 [Tephrocybe rancida]